MLAAWLWTVPSAVAIFVFGFIVFKALVDRGIAAATHDQAMRVVAVERMLTALGLLAMSVFSAFVGVVSLIEPPDSFVGKLALWSLIAVPWVHLLIGVNIVVGRKKAS